ncbi:electron transport complex subunit RsxC [Vibrio sp. ZSDE26]|uniref:Ion-translocating oxidoreductase complex subunit C n=1 Tax=Vibrio amylolyticus TaxID=2847292 RepID=A0A9X2BGR6_9VIBR|nr:electron transport complex subunit RsxC [Vibrio amylolyticus]MCK6262160.1 electron transport complex subunit RsxC [Vibrio amylolyticus]
MNTPSLIEQIKTGKLWDFHGGIHPQENKTQSNQLPPVWAALPNELVVPIKQHIGKAGDLIVNSGDKVLKGQPLTQYNTSMMLPVHAPTSGVITAIEPRATNHPSGLSETCIVISPDGHENWCDKNIIEDFRSESAETLMEHIRLAGISGMGGAGFPTAKKIQSGLSKTEILIINAAECEPFITSDDVLMQHYADEIMIGIDIVDHILAPKLTIIAIEDNKPEAIKALELAAKDKDIVIRVIPTKFPSGGEKQLIKLLTNQEVPKGGIPAEIGMLVQNVASMYAIKRAICHGEPLIQRLVTLTGQCFSQPRNVWALFGTSVKHLVEQFEYKAQRKNPRIIMGGPMMGYTLPHSNIPITKTSNCLLAPSANELPANQYEMACIRCSQCAEVCPSSLLPQQLQWHAKAEEFDKCTELNLQDCIECGACAYVCPSEIPLVHYYRQAKAEIRSRKEEAQAAERARQRFEEKNARLERAKAERENKFKKAADNRRSEMKQKGGDDAVAAAIARVKAQKESAESNAGNKEIKPAVAAAIARAKAKQAQAQGKEPVTEPDNSEMSRLRAERKQRARDEKRQQQNVNEATPSTDSQDANNADIIEGVTEKDPKKAAIAAAVARAKARKAKQETSDISPNSEPAEPVNDDPKKAAVAAAIARAKARKAKQETSDDAPSSESAEPVNDDPKKAAVAAAIARAKARKAKQEASDETPNSEPTEPVNDDPKKAAVAAAIARAKARKAKQEASDETPNSEATESVNDDPKKAAVAAAIARAKARKAKQEASADAPSSEPTEPVNDDPKKAAVAAAIARAKARKAKQEALASEPQDNTKEKN